MILEKTLCSFRCQGGALRVVVRRPAEQDPSIQVPVVRAQVQLIPAFQISQQDLHLSDATNTDGRAAFSPLPAGLYTVDITAPGLPPVVKPATLNAGETAELEFLLVPPAVASPAPTAALPGQ